MFDHSGIVSLSRMIVEGATACSYLAQPVDEAEWVLRHAVLRLHDTVARIKFLRSFPDPIDDLRAARTELEAEIRGTQSFAKLDQRQQDRLLTGEEIFVGGMRRAAQIGMGWDPDRLTSIYAYFSAHAHSAPMSFMRMALHKVDYYYPSEAQFNVATFAVEVAIASLRRTSLRRMDQHPELVDRFPLALVEEFRKEDANSAVFDAASPPPTEPMP
jgi:hypothetical protein